MNDVTTPATALPDSFYPFRSTLWIGRAGSGKTVALRAVVEEWNGPVYVIATDPAEWAGRRTSPRVNWLVENKPVDTVTLLEMTLALIRDRAQRATGPDWQRARLLVVVDDLRQLIHKNDYATELIGRVLKQGRTLGVYVHATVQRFDYATLGGLLRDFPQILETRAPRPPTSLTDHPYSDELLDAVRAYGALRDAPGQPIPDAEPLVTGISEVLASGTTQRAGPASARASLRWLGMIGHGKSRVFTLRIRDGGG
jgi:hypothetical protein